MRENRVRFGTPPRHSPTREFNGERHYLWRAVDHEREILESHLIKT